MSITTQRRMMQRPTVAPAGCSSCGQRHALGACAVAPAAQAKLDASVTAASAPPSPPQLKASVGVPVMAATPVLSVPGFASAAAALQAYADRGIAQASPDLDPCARLNDAAARLMTQMNGLRLSTQVPGLPPLTITTFLHWTSLSTSERATMIAQAWRAYGGYLRGALASDAAVLREVALLDARVAPYQEQLQNTRLQMQLQGCSSTFPRKAGQVAGMTDGLFGNPCLPGETQAQCTRRASDAAQAAYVASRPAPLSIPGDVISGVTQAATSLPYGSDVLPSWVATPDGSWLQVAPGATPAPAATAPTAPAANTALLVIGGVAAAGLLAYVLMGASAAAPPAPVVTVRGRR